MCVCVCVCMCVYIYIFVCVCVCMCVYIYTHIYVCVLYIYIIFIGIQLLYNVVLVSTIQQSESVMHIHKSISFWISFPFRCRFNPCVGKTPGSRKWQPILVFLPGESHGQRSLVGYSPWGHKELDTTEHTHIPFSSPQSIK